MDNNRLVPRRPAPTPADVGFAVAGGVASRLSSIDAVGEQQDASDGVGATAATAVSLTSTEEETAGDGYLTVFPGSDGVAAVDEDVVPSSPGGSAAASATVPNQAAGSKLNDCDAGAAAASRLKRLAVQQPSPPPPSNASSSSAHSSSAPQPSHPPSIALSGGWLQKYNEKGFIKSWKHRWFELHPNRKLLFYYKTKPERGGGGGGGGGGGSTAAPLGQILIEHATISLSKMAGREPPGNGGHFTIRCAMMMCLREANT